MRPKQSLSTNTRMHGMVVRRIANICTPAPRRFAGQVCVRRKCPPYETFFRAGTLALLSVALLLLAVGCTASDLVAPPGTSEPSDVDATPTGIWSGLLQKTPYPYHTPLPPPTPTILDGTYTKFELREGTPVPCKRCPDYAPEGGVWKLSLDKGVFRIFHEVTGWRSLGSYTLLGDRLVLINDPYCPDVVGSYRWKVEEGELILEEIEDRCSIGLRAMNLTNLPWRSCRSPSTEAAVTDHWPQPPGCD